jgi:hypothetical protein
MNHERGLGLIAARRGLTGAIPAVRTRKIIGSGLCGRLAI